MKTSELKVGDRVRLTRATRHNMIPKGQVGRVTEIRTSGNCPGITVEFMKKPSPQIAAIFGKDPNVAEPFLCLFPFTARQPFVRV